MDPTSSSIDRSLPPCRMACKAVCQPHENLAWYFRSRLQNHCCRWNNHLLRSFLTEMLPRYCRLCCWLSYPEKVERLQSLIQMNFHEKGEELQLLNPMNFHEQGEEFAKLLDQSRCWQEENWHEKALPAHLVRMTFVASVVVASVVAQPTVLWRWLRPGLVAFWTGKSNAHLRRNWKVKLACVIFVIFEIRANG